jgi:hypothetical protein
METVKSRTIKLNQTYAVEYCQRFYASSQTFIDLGILGSCEGVEEQSLSLPPSF